MVNRLACLRGDAWSRLLEGLGLWWRALFASFRRPRAGEREQALLQFLKVSFLRDSLFQSATPQLEVLFSGAYHSIGAEELVTLVQQVRHLSFYRLCIYHPSLSTLICLCLSYHLSTYIITEIMTTSDTQMTPPLRQKAKTN